MIFNYHKTAKKLIVDGHLINFQVMPRWKMLSPALVLFFDNHEPMPISKYNWDKYWDILDEWDANRPSPDTP